MKRCELKLAVKLLRMAADLYANHGCNDLDVELLEDFSPEQQAQLLADFNAYNGGDPEDAIESIRGLPDYSLMHLMASKLESIEP